MSTVRQLEEQKWQFERSLKNVGEWMEIRTEIEKLEKRIAEDTLRLAELRNDSPELRAARRQAKIQADTEAARKEALSRPPTVWPWGPDEDRDI